MANAIVPPQPGNPAFFAASSPLQQQGATAVAANMNVVLARMENAQRNADRRLQEILMDRMYRLEQERMSMNREDAQAKMDYNHRLVDLMEKFSNFKMVEMAKQFSNNSNMIETMEKTATESGDTESAKAAADAKAKLEQELEAKKKESEIRTKLKEAWVSSFDPKDPASLERIMTQQLTIPGMQNPVTVYDMVSMAKEGKLDPSMSGFVLDMVSDVATRMQEAPQISKRQQLAHSIISAGKFMDTAGATPTINDFVFSKDSKDLFSQYQEAARTDGVDPNESLITDYYALKKMQEGQAALADVTRYTRLQKENEQELRGAQNTLKMAQAGQNQMTPPKPSPLGTPTAPAPLSPSSATPASPVATQQAPLIGDEPDSAGVKWPIAGTRVETLPSRPVMSRKRWLLQESGPTMPQQTPSAQSQAAAPPQPSSPWSQGFQSAQPPQDAEPSRTPTSKSKPNAGLIESYAMQNGMDSLSLYNRVRMAAYDSKTGMLDLGKYNNEVYNMFTQGYAALAADPELPIGPLGDYYAKNFMAPAMMAE